MGEAKIYEKIYLGKLAERHSQDKYTLALAYNSGLLPRRAGSAVLDVVGHTNSGFRKVSR